MFEVVEKLKRELTDQYVQVNAKTPELARFAGLTGQVKTVNMSGRALVQFDAWNNIGWYDIGVDFLKVVPKPEPRPAEEKHAKKPAAAKPQTSADSPAVAPKPVGAAAAAEKKPSVAEMLRAQAAAKKSGETASAAAPQVAAAPPAAAPAPEVKVEAPPAPKEAPKPAAPAGEKKLTTAEIMAALRKKP